MSWEQMLDIFAVNAEEYRTLQNEVPVECPNDGTPLQSGPNGELFCIFDGWQYPRDYVRP